MCVFEFAVAQGGPPLLTDDPGTPRNRNWEINVAAITERSSSEKLWEAPLLDINYGAGSRVQLKFELPLVSVAQGGLPYQTGMGNSLVGVKWRFRDEGTHGTNISVYPQLEFNNPGSSVDRGIVERGTQFLLPVQWQRPVGPIDLNAEVGYSFAQYRNDEWMLGLAAGRKITPRLELLAEVHSVGEFRTGDHNAVFDLGGRWRLSERYVLLLMAGRSFRGTTSGEPQFFAYTGIQFDFGK